MTSKDGTSTQSPRDSKTFIGNLPATPIFVDNKGTTRTVTNPVSTAQKSKHLDVRYFRIRDHIRDSKLRVHWIGAHWNVPDFFTKALPSPAFPDFKEKLMGHLNRNDSVVFKHKPLTKEE